MGEDEFIGQIECKERNFESTMYDIPIEEIVLEVSNATIVFQILNFTAVTYFLDKLG